MVEGQSELNGEISTLKKDIEEMMRNVVREEMPQPIRKVVEEVLDEKLRTFQRGKDRRLRKAESPVNRSKCLWNTTSTSGWV